VVAELGRRGETSVRLTSGPDDVDDALRRLDRRRLVVAGGDGSLHVVVNRLLTLGLSDVPVAIVPLGTGNDLARGLGLSLDPARAARAAHEGTPRPLPVILHEADGEAAINNAHLGIGERAARIAVGLKPRLGALAYPVGALRAGLRPERRVLTVRIDGRTVHEGPLQAVVVGLGPSAGGGHQVLPAADPTEAALEVLIVGDGTARARVAVAATVVAGRDPARRSGAGRWRGQRVDVEGADGSQRWDVDGEAREWSAPVGLVVRPAAWWSVR
jgi:diacylglycerol kinase family enzyme